MLGIKTSSKWLSIGIVGGGPAGLCLALVLSKLELVHDNVLLPIRVRLYEKRTERTRMQTLFLDFDNILKGASGIGGGLAVLFKELWPILQTRNTCVVSAPFFGDPTCFKVKDLKYFEATNPKTGEFDNIPNHLGGLSIPIQSLETCLEEIVAKQPNIEMVRREVKDLNVLVAKHAILFGCEGRKSVVAQAIKSDKIKLPGIRKPHELHAMLVRWKAEKPHVRDQPFSTPNHAQHQRRVFYSPDGNLTFIVQFRLKEPKEAEMVYSSMPEHLKSIVDTAFRSFEPKLGHIPLSASVLLINIEPYYRAKAASVVQNQHGTSLLALLGDSLMGVAFLSGWGLNSAFRQINVFEEALKSSLSHATLARNSVSETLWLLQIGSTYADQVYFGASMCIKESIIRTLAVVPRTVFTGSNDDLTNTAWNEHSAVLVNRLKFNVATRVVASQSSAFAKHRDHLERLLQNVKSQRDLNALWAWYHRNPSFDDMPDWKFVNQSVLVVHLAQGFKEVSKPSNKDQPLEAEMTLFQLYSQDQLHKGFLVRPSLGKLPTDYTFNELKKAYSHLRVKPLASHWASVRARAMLACILVVDHAWSMVRKLESSTTDLAVFIFKKSDFEDSLPNVPIVRSLYEIKGKTADTHSDYEGDVVDMMQQLKTHVLLLGDDVRALVIVDKTFGRHINYLLSIMRRLWSKRVKDVYTLMVGNSGLYR